jgi:hypothetical protein
MESAAYYNQKLLANLYLNSSQLTRRFIESFGYCYPFNSYGYLEKQILER